jgi:hypothetical protein
MLGGKLDLVAMHDDPGFYPPGRRRWHP